MGAENPKEMSLAGPEPTFCTTRWFTLGGIYGSS